jgi:hypothetical protein
LAFANANSSSNTNFSLPVIAIPFNLRRSRFRDPFVWWILAPSPTAIPPRASEANPGKNRLAQKHIYLALA